MKKGEKMDYLNAEKAFENAIKKGLENPNDYMYMYTIEKKDYFKHINSRKYISFRIEEEEE